MLSKKFLPLLLLAAVLSLTGRATEQLVNGSFEDATTAPWYTDSGLNLTTIGYSTATDIDGPGTAFGMVGFAKAYFSGGVGSLFQNFTLGAAGQFTYSFFLSRSELTSSSNDVPVGFSLFVDGQLLDNTLPAWGQPSGIHPDQVSVWTPYAGAVDLQAGNHVLQMQFSRGDSGFGRGVVFQVDAVATNFIAADGNPVNRVPESAATLLLTGVGLGLLGLFRRTAVGVACVG